MCQHCHCAHTERTHPSLPSWSFHFRGQGGQGRQRCQAPLKGRCGETFTESALGLRISARLLLDDQVCYCLDSESRFVDGMGLVSERAVPGPTPCTGAVGGSVEGKARALTAACPSTPGAISFILGWLDQYLEDSFQTSLPEAADGLHASQPAWLGPGVLCPTSSEPVPAPVLALSPAPELEPALVPARATFNFRASSRVSQF